ncbi:MAG: DUF6228 family protein [Hydrogenophaga sp.]|uniref:DUF6228 family protein n=1 Tax=Hydrogenophaga sp. TaxID=1904254 RepID=UPI003D9B4A69
MSSAIFKAAGDGSLLTFEVTSSSATDVDFNVHVRTPHFAGQAPASTFMNGSPSALFAEMASEWTGWRGQKTWQDLESRVSFSASSDSTGHVTLRVELKGQDYDSGLTVNLMFEASQLDAMASSISELLG